MKYDVLSLRERTSTLTVEGNRVTARKNADLERHGIRRFENGLLYQASRVGAATVERLLTDSREWGGPGTPHDFGFAPPHSEKRQGHSLSVNLLGEFEEAVREFIDRHPDFVFSGKCAAHSATTSLRSNYGLDLEASGSHCEWYLVYQRKGSGSMFDGWVSETTSAPSVREALERHSEFLEAEKREASVKAGRLPVLLVSTDGVLEKLIESCSVRHYYEGTCVFAGQLGRDLFSPAVTIFDESYDPSTGHNQFFDGEGVLRTQSRLTLIENGRMNRLMSDLRFGKKYGVPSTGNGVRSTNRGVALAPRSIRFKPGGTPWRKLVTGLDQCIVATVAAGGDSNDLGEFSTPVQAAYVFEKGELVGRAPQITVKTTVADYLGKNLVGISSDGYIPSSSSPCVVSEMDVYVN